MSLFCLACRPLVALFCLLSLVTRSAVAGTPLDDPALGNSLAAALNPDGTLRPGASGSFDARQFRMSAAPDGRPVFRPIGTAGVSDERWADGFGLPNGTNEDVRAVASFGTTVYIGGRFTVAGNVAANYVAKWDGTSWSSLGTGRANGMNDAVFSLAVNSTGDLYAGGYFSQAGGMPASGVAKWNGRAWSNLGSGLANQFSGIQPAVWALAVAGNGDLYAGGIIGRAGGVVANNVAKWDGTSWSSLGTGTSNGVNNTV